ncbi:MAG: sigma-70 family RNA polymerase sigma factor [Clostridiales bacterium]|nr:sigma-70 family RNA polymerase sigma factor [Clostridiales bacterium]
MIQEELVSTCADAVYRFCRSVTWRREDAEDLFQDTFFSAFRQLRRIEKMDSPCGFLLSTAAYLWRSRKRKYARRRDIAPETEFAPELRQGSAPSAEEEFFSQEEITLCRRMVEELPDNYRLLVVMYYTNGLRVNEIASALGIPPGTVKSRLSQARSMIEKGMVSEYGKEA